MAEKQLRELLTALRAECGHSTNVAHGLNDRESMVYLLDRTQTDLIESYDWPSLQVDRDVTLATDQRFYPYPADLRFEDINIVWLMDTAQTFTLEYDITPNLLTIYNSDAGITGWPPQRWLHRPDTNSFEVWPIPDGSANQGRLRLRGTMTVPQMIEDSDVCVLPWRIIVLTAASEVLAQEEDPAAAVKARRAGELIRRYRVRLGSHKTGVTPYGDPPGRFPGHVGDYRPAVGRR
jgi:hypothetical protein